MNIRNALAGTACVATALALVPASAGADSLKFDGSRTDLGSKEITSYSWGVSNQGSSSGGGAGRASVQELTISSRVSANSPNFANRAATGNPVQRAQVYVDGNEVFGMGFCMEGVEFLNYDVSGSDDDLGEETIVMQFEKLSQVVFFQDAFLAALFDLKTGKFTLSTTNPCPTG
jgi:type VI secretion system secreted protein Hcp